MHNPTLHQGPLGKDFAMNRTRPSTHVLTSGFSIGFFLSSLRQSGLAAEAVGGPTRIHVDPGHVVARSVDRKLGIGLNFTIDRNDRTLAMRCKSWACRPSDFRKASWVTTGISMPPIRRVPSWVSQTPRFGTTVRRPTENGGNRL